MIETAASVSRQMRHMTSATSGSLYPPSAQRRPPLRELVVTVASHLRAVPARSLVTTFKRDRLGRSSQQLLNNLSTDVGQPEVSALVAVG